MNMVVAVKIHRVAPTDIRRIIRRIDPEQPISEIETMNDIVRDTMTLARRVLHDCLLRVQRAAGTLGVYRVVSYSVRQRTVEIGTRVAWDPPAGRVLSLIVGGGLR